VAEYLLFQLYGPMASWGDTAVGEERPSQVHPGKSALIGLLAAALGIRRHQEERLAALAEGYRIAVQVRHPGILLRDYHTVQVPPRVALKNHPHSTRRDEIQALARYQRKKSGAGTLLSSREYRCDASYRVALAAAGSPPHTLKECAKALRYPQLPVYLGRKACPPALPLQPQVVSAKSVRDAFQTAVFSAIDEITARPIHETVSVYWEDGMEGGFSTSDGLKTLRRRDRPLSRRRWQFAERNEHHAIMKMEE